MRETSGIFMAGFFFFIPVAIVYALWTHFGTRTGMDLVRFPQTPAGDQP